MNLASLNALALLIDRDRELLLMQWREQVRQIPSAEELETPRLNDHVPKFLDELCVALRSGNKVSIPESIGVTSPASHGMQRLSDGLTSKKLFLNTTY